MISSRMKLLMSLSTKDSGLNSMQESLSKLYRQTLKELKIGPRMWSILLNYYCKKYRELIYGTPASLKGNITKAVLRPKISFMYFTRAVGIIAQHPFTFYIEMDFDNSKYTTGTTHHEITVLGTPNEDPDLRGLYQIILKDLNIDAKEWSSLLDQYCKSEQFKLYHGEHTKPNTYKTSLTKVLAKNRMMFGSFVKAILLLNPRNIRIGIKLSYKDVITTHTIELNPIMYLEF